MKRTLVVLGLIGSVATIGCGEEKISAVPAPAVAAVKEKVKKMAPKPLHAAAHVITSKDLVVEIMDPTDPKRYHTGQRFTNVAAVLRVTMGGEEFFFHALKHNPASDHAGLASEFDLHAETPPPGFADAKKGEGFIKIGVGILEKNRDQWAFYLPQKLLQPAKTTVKWGKSVADFQQVCNGVNGYAYRLTAKVKAVGKTLSVAWTLKNIGTKPFQTHNYVHNFFRMSDRNVGPDYVLSFPYDYKATGLGKEQKQVKRDLLFLKEIPKHVNIVVKAPKGYKGKNTVIARHTKTGQAIHCETSIPGTRTAVHASKTYLCPEQFIRLELKPGESKSWTRSYTFEKTK